ncbi:MAG TPA: metallophosphoesterase [bacterium]
MRKLSDHDFVRPGDPAQRPNHSEVLTFYVLGDWGTGNENQRAVALALKKNVAELPSDRTQAPFVLELGDNVYEVGLKEGWNEPLTTTLLHQTFGEIYSQVKYNGRELRYHIIPGNHDHAGRTGGKYGWGDIIHQETTAEALYPNWRYYPIDPSLNSDNNDSTNYVQLKEAEIFALTIPERVPAARESLLGVYAIDTQVILEIYQKKDNDLLQKHWQTLEALLSEDKRWKIVMGHHPVKSHGKHAGFRTAIWWIPPITLFTVVDKLFYKRLQDLDNPSYRRFRKDLIALMKKHDVPFYFSGHEHNLQFLEIDSEHFQIISGSAGKLSAVTHKDDTLFSHSAFGFARCDVTEDELWIEFFEAVADGYRSNALYKITKK